LLEQRKDVATYLRDGIKTLAGRHGERLLISKGNNISFAMTVDRVASSPDAPTDDDGRAYGDKRATTFLGSMLFTRNVSGARAVHPKEMKVIDGYTFESYGASFTGYPHAYITAAGAMGMTRDDVDVYLHRLEKCLKEMQKTAKDKTAVHSHVPPA
jgi:O-phospho-L-seryl-tRNASec:L-selenocysteinyl-tRNA synthase